MGRAEKTIIAGTEYTTNVCLPSLWMFIMEVKKKCNTIKTILSPIVAYKNLNSIAVIQYKKLSLIPLKMACPS